MDMMKLLEEIENGATRYPWAADIFEQLRDLYEENACPEYPSGPFTSVRLPVCFDPGEAESENYDPGIIALYECAGYSYQGNNQWLKFYRRGSDAWEAYLAAATLLVDEYVLNDAWNDFCDWPEFSTYE